MRPERPSSVFDKVKKLSRVFATSLILMTTPVEATQEVQEIPVPAGQGFSQDQKDKLFKMVFPEQINAPKLLSAGLLKQIVVNKENLNDIRNFLLDWVKNSITEEDDEDSADLAESIRVEVGDKVRFHLVVNSQEDVNPQLRLVIVKKKK